MRLYVDGFVRTGTTVDARALPVAGETVAAAVRGADTSVTVDAPTPGPVHGYIGHIRPEMSLSVKTALAAAARSQGHSAPVDEELAAARERLSALSVPGPDETPVAETDGTTAPATEVRRLRERTAELRGRINALEEYGADTSTLRTELAETARALSEAETDRMAATQRREERSAELRDVRDEREERLRLQDRVGNLRRTARAQLVDAVRGKFAAAVASAPGPTPADPFAVDETVAALAIARVADVRAPLVLDCDCFETPAAAAQWLDAPVVLTESV